MENKAISVIKEFNMISDGDCIVTGLSGGADSCALLHFLASLREKKDLRLIACHVNHMLRGKEADRDEEFARSFCKRLNIEFFLLKKDINALAESLHQGTEQCGRDVRYSFFRETAEKFNAKIATAHTASDNAETILFNLARGSGVRGLCGIPPVRDNIIRPLITSTREEIEDYCRRNDISYVTDSTNLANEYNRNKIRHDVIPVLRQINPAFEQAAARTSSIMRSTDNYIRCQAKELLCAACTEKGYKAKTLYNSDEVVFAQAVSILCEPFDIIPEAVHISLIRKICSENGSVELKSKIFAVSNQGYLRIIKKTDTKNSDEIEFTGQNIIVINDKKLNISIVNIDEFNNRKKNDKFIFHNSLDYDTISLSALFRCRRSGDRFRPAGRGISKTIKKLFCEMKIPAEQRDSILLLANGNDILWIEGIGAAQDHSVSSKTRQVMLIEAVETEAAENA